MKKMRSGVERFGGGAATLEQDRDARETAKARIRDGGDRSVHGRGPGQPEMSAEAAVGPDTKPRSKRSVGGNIDPPTSEKSPSHKPAKEEADDHIGATDDEVDPVPAPAGDAFNDEPRQG